MPQLFAGLCLPKNGLVCVGFVFDRVLATGQVSLRVLWCCPFLRWFSLSRRHCYRGNGQSRYVRHTTTALVLLHPARGDVCGNRFMFM